MAQYYTLEEAAQVLQTTQDEAKKLAEAKKVRTFRDRGTLRYRSQDIDELARSMGLGSDASLQLGEVPPPKRTTATPPPSKVATGKTPAPGKKPAPPKDEGEVFNFSLGDESDQVELGELAPPGPASSHGGGPKSSKSRLTPRTPPPKPGSDSDVRLVSDGSDVDFQIAADSDLSKQSRTPKSGPSSSNLLGKGKKGQPPARPDSGVRILPLDDDSDSDVKMVLDDEEESVSLGGAKAKTGSDSDIRLEQTDAPLRLSDEGSDPALVTEEIDLDAELRKQQAAEPPKSKRKLAPPPSPKSKLPTGSPFELSEADAGEERQTIKPQRKATQHAPYPPPVEEDSDNFELVPGGADPSSGEMSPLELSDEELRLQPMEDSDEVGLGAHKPQPGASGINLDKPVDSGISLEDSTDSADFELTLDDPGHGAAEADDSSSEFELSLDDSSGEGEALQQEGSDSEFELSLDAEGSSEFELEAAGDSSSEFELTLDESGSMEPAAEEAEADIFETDFEVPALDDDSASEAVALDDSDTDLESSDFDIALEEGDAESEDESASQVVALEDEEESAEGDETVARPRGKTTKKKTAAVDFDEEADFSDIEQEEAEAAIDEEEEAVGGKGGQRVPAASVPWGPVPGLVLTFSLLPLIVIGFMAFELLQGMWGYQKGNKVSTPVLQFLTESLTGEKLPE